MHGTMEQEPQQELDTTVDLETEETDEGGSSPTWFAVLTEPSPEFHTRVVEGRGKADLKRKLKGIDARTIYKIIRGREIATTTEVSF